MEAFYKFIQIRAGERPGLQGEIHVRAQVVNPQLFRPGRLAGRFAVEEQQVGLHALGVKDAGRQAQQGVHLAFVQQLAAHGFARPALEEHVVGHYDRCLAVDFQQRLDVLDEIELLVAGGGPEVVTHGEFGY